MGAMDVCPFIPVSGITMADCVVLSETFARRAAEELGVPLYLYEDSARHAYRRKLSQIREGEYEGLAAKLKDPKWKPDFGPAEFVPEWGATVTGARFFLIAYNVNIIGTPNQAHRIALNLREAGRGPRQPGRLKEVKGLGWFVQEYNLAQVSVNLTNYRVTPPHLLFEAVQAEAAALKVGVAGSEIVGLVPLEAILMAAEYYIRKENLFVIEEDRKIRLAVERLGLNAVAPFNPREKIIEYIVAEPPDEPLAGSPLRTFIENIAARTSTPGGGSASAAMAAFGTALGEMASQLTYGVRKFESVDAQMRAIIPVLHDATQNLIPQIDADTSAFNEYMQGLRMPKETPSEEAARRAKMQSGLKTAIDVPLKTMRLADAAWDALCDAARYANPAAKSDLQVAARALETGIWGAYRNVCINMTGIEDRRFESEILATAEKIADRAVRKCAEVLKILDKRSSVQPE